MLEALERLLHAPAPMIALGEARRGMLSVVEQGRQVRTLSRTDSVSCGARPNRRDGGLVLKAADAATLAAALKPFVPADLVLCSDGNVALAAAARQLGAEHHAINLSAGICADGAWYIQKVFAYHSRLKAWVRKFNGVATRYLADYLGWFRTIDRDSTVGLSPPQWLALAMGNHV